MTIDHHQLAIVSLIGCSFDVVGALYLAYDLLGGKHGPLRTVTRAVTYTLLFTVGYSVPFGLAFGIFAGWATGATIAVELARQSRTGEHYSEGWELFFAAIRALGFGIGAIFIYGVRFGATFGLLSFAGQAFAYRLGFRPGMDYDARRSPRITRGLLIAGLNRTLGYAFAGYLSAAVAHHQMHALMFGLEAGLGVGVVTAAAVTVTPYVEWFSETLRERTMGAVGIVMIFCGFLLQSVQYWLALFDVPVQ